MRVYLKGALTFKVCNFAANFFCDPRIFSSGEGVRSEIERFNKPETKNCITEANIISEKVIRDAYLAPESIWSSQHST